MSSSMGGASQSSSAVRKNQAMKAKKGNNVNSAVKCTISTKNINLAFVAICIIALCCQIYGTTLTFREQSASLFTSESEMRQRQKSSSESLLRQQEQHRLLSGGYHFDKDDSVFAQSFPEKYRVGSSPHNGRLRVLVGILSADFFNDQVYRKRHRTLFRLWNDPRVCSLPEFKTKPLSERYVCELIYTFVVGANPKASPELVDNSRPFEVNRPITGVSRDLNEPDMTLLNIRENMNEGKSQTWMYYGATIAEEYDLDYVAKCDADSIFHLHEFFHFAYKNMPPAPYNSMMYIGALRDKAYWPKHATEKERIQFESYFGMNYDGVHLYIAGQLYILATDLAKYVGKEALANNCSYCEGHEDHDISAMAFHSPEPIKMVVIGRSHRFWEHPVKGEPRWKRILAREQARMSGQPFEGKLFTTNSSIFDVLGPSADITV
jgi:Galactosyltransferase